MFEQFTVAFFVFLCTVILSSSATNEESASAVDGGFIFIVPKSLRAGKKETACLSLHGDKINKKAEISVNIKTPEFEKENSVLTKKSFDAENVGCFELRIPETQKTMAQIQVQIKFPDDSASNYTVNTINEINIVQNNDVVFIQTDKEIYKPGDRVKIRILILNYELNVPKNLTIPIVKIKNPINIVIGQWENVITDLGLVQLEHQLSQETMLGIWSVEFIEAKHVYKTFEVKEYVLPRFEVTAEYKKTMFLYAKTFDFTVCARYTYGLGIKGTGHFKIIVNDFPVNQLKELKNGCANFSFNRTDVPLKLHESFGLRFTASVTEQGTGQMSSISDEVTLSNTKYILQFVDMSSNFQHGLPYRGQVKVIESFEDIQNKKLKICYNFGIHFSWNLTRQTCSIFTLNNTNFVEFHVLPFEENIQEIRFAANIEDEISIENIEDFSAKNIFYHSVSKWFSPSNSFIQIFYEGTSPLKCKSWQTFNLLFTLNSTKINVTKNDPIEFNYLIKSKGIIIKFGKVIHTPCSSNAFDVTEYKNIIGNNSNNIESKLPIDKFILTIKVHQKMYSGASLIVYYVRNDGEVVSTGVDFAVENCLANKVEMVWSGTQNYPGESTNLKIKANSGSLCALSAVDKKTTLLSSVSNHLDANVLLKHVEKQNIFDEETFAKCKKDHRLRDDYSSIPFWDLKRKKRFYSDFSTFYDTFQVFNDNGLLIISDLIVVTRPCGFDVEDIQSRSMWNVMAPIFYSKPYQNQGTDMGANVRSFFPETWLWELIPIGKTGEEILKKDLPHSITQWIGNIFCVSPLTGFGISHPVNITTFKPFFVEIISPFSIKRNEISHIKIVVHNYLNHSLPVGISLGLSKYLRPVGPREENFRNVCIGANDSSVNTFRIIGSGLGRHNFSITAEVDSSYPGECGPEVLLNRKDIVLQNILIQAEGFPFERIISNFACAKDLSKNTTTNETPAEDELNWNVEVPQESIKNSSRLKILLDADLLELTIENLGTLLKIPTGCGEQIMSTLAPNFYILRYLNTTGSLTNEIKNRAQNNIRIGYEKILQYRHKDGSFSAFGEHNSPGSMFLTAFVLRTFSQASGFVYVDENVVKQAAIWVMEKQMENGCFPDYNFVFQSGITGDHGNENNVGLTAYVLISLIESGLPIPKNVIDNAKYCLRGYNSIDKYTRVIITYALTLVKWENEALRSLERLLEVSVRKNGLLYWDESESLAKSLEITSYMILSLINMNNSDHTALAHESVRWLLTKRNFNGGFVSTQDTVVALDALTKFALVAKKDETNLTVFVATGGKQFNFRMKNKAKLKTKQITLSKFSNFVKFRIEGSGCILIQTLLKYNMPQIISNEALKLAVSTNSVSTVDKCGVAQVSSCFSYIIPNRKVNMAVLELFLPSGYKADRASLFKLTEHFSETRVEKYEEIDNKVVLYFTEITSEKICISFLINEQNLIENRTEAIVHLFDYYNPQIETLTSYTLPNCSTAIQQTLNDIK